MKIGQIIVVVAALVLTVLIYNFSRTPNDADLPTQEAEEVATVASENPALDAKVEEAVNMIQSGNGAPMQAIGLLREVIQVDSNHVGANFWLGEFSLMSGQYDKAIERFNKLLQMQPANAEFCIKLAQSYQGAGQTSKGVEVINAFIAANPEEKMNEQLNAVLEKMSVEL